MCIEEFACLSLARGSFLAGGENHRLMEDAFYNLRRRYAEKYGSVEGTAIFSNPCTSTKIGWTIHRYYKICA